VGDRGGEATTLNNIGLVYDALGDKARALEFYEQALPLLQQIGDRWHERMLRRNMIVVCASLSQLEIVEKHLLQVVALDEALDHPDLESDRAVLARVQAMLRGQENIP
jgi:hypothetical protein